ncbi:MAG TPA: DUF4384 domain-containing protein [Pyrinomonadaceae bacterium]|nr:DUF4384 domain-containing protein [Pyrinomonadaceae bacterium]
MITRKLLSAACIMFSFFLVAGATLSPAPQDEDESSRQITLDRFNKARPFAQATGGIDNAASKSAAKPPVYRRAGNVRLPASRRGQPPPATEEIGITVWRLRPARAGDEGGQVLVLDGTKQTAYTPERIEANTPLNVGDRVRLTVESPRPGFLYIIDREQYADGSLGEPLLIFPTKQTRGGDNRVAPGKLIDIPAQEDQYSYFTAQPAGNRRDQVAEVLTVILTPAPLSLTVGNQPLKLTEARVDQWDKLWGGVAETLELVGGAGRTWTNEEKIAGAANGRQLTQSGPPPQTVYRVARKTGGQLLVTVPLRYARS